jgi:hypothetical protein
MGSRVLGSWLLETSSVTMPGCYMDYRPLGEGEMDSGLLER